MRATHSSTRFVLRSIAAAVLLVPASVTSCSSSQPDDAIAARSDAVVDCADDGTLEGVDVSEHNGWIDWSSAAGEIDFAYIKATQGAGYVDPQFQENWPNAKSAGVVRGAYHFFDPTVDGVAQANHYLSLVGALGESDLPPALDLECPDGNPQCLGYPGGDGWAPGDVIAQRALDFLETVHAATGKRPIIYTYSYWFTGAGVDPAPFGAYPLWFAMIDPSDGCLSLPSAWSTWTVWQYGWHGWVSGIASETDVDRFNGTMDDLLAFAAGDGGGGATTASCDALGYEGDCVGAVSVWSEGGTCRVRDCGGEGKACGLLSADVGYGCLGGTAGAMVAGCASYGYEGACLSDTLVWAEDGECRAVYCPADGRSCGWDDSVGYNCL